MKRPDGRPATRAFESAWNTIYGGKRHIDAFIKADREFFRSQPGEHFTEDDVTAGIRLYKFRYKREAPAELGLIAADIVCNLRAALDQACFACALALHGGRPKNTHFPFGDTEAEVLNRRVGGSRELPPQVFEAFVSKCRPHRDGNVWLWALGKIANAHKHEATVVHAGAAMHTLDMMVRQGMIPFSYSGWPEPPRWDAQKKELVWASVSLDSQVEPVLQNSISQYVEFSRPAEVTGRPAAQAMMRMGDEVIRAMLIAEDKLVELGLVPAP